MQFSPLYTIIIAHYSMNHFCIAQQTQFTILPLFCMLYSKEQYFLFGQELDHFVLSFPLDHADSAAPQKLVCLIIQLLCYISVSYVLVTGVVLVSSSQLHDLTSRGQCMH